MNTHHLSIAVIGGGTMGAGITQLFASNGHRVKLIDIDTQVLSKAKLRISGELERLGFEKTNIEQVLSNIEWTNKIEEANSVSIIIEAVPEKIDLKMSVLNELESVCSPETIIATNTSGLSIDRLAKELAHPERFIGTHFFMPANVIPLVEVVKGASTSEKTIEIVMTLLKDNNKKPVLIKKDIPGFIGNRIQHAMAREAISLLEQGVASAEDIDTVVRYSLGPRLLFTGPLEQRDLNGLDVHYHIASYLYEELENRTEPAQLLTEKVEAGELGIKTGKGFYDWNNHDAQSVLENKNAAILQLMKALKAME
ncbi:3-hydroxyacyl-CoA dehydrogenase NAD-binding domain-containing protein [Cytobacillus horneckiae]|uniref:3-hydroxyacyl-CoA dehydrogenase NAD-binding domain-containing protein n=1 Tax=Cytobacillus horneckiae TaxID=549687 RepID=UPI003D9A1725